MAVGPLRGVQSALFGLGGGPGDKLSLNMLILIGGLAYFASFLPYICCRSATRRRPGISATRPPGPSAGWRCPPGCVAR